ncbi:uncharacterized protein LOC121642441 [Melanotaenia boesemani]|uniref:uncharacterized protein LOC121642441 n=1 Tax=Melanotaenia boesemani TaxID=1250792 RepID=UPI001C049AA2|nr:uncharacterized protein LOC121642441 [Melanotaenia boesemani]
METRDYANLPVDGVSRERKPQRYKCSSGGFNIFMLVGVSFGLLCVIQTALNIFLYKEVVWIPNKSNVSTCNVTSHTTDGISALMLERDQLIQEKEHHLKEIEHLNFDKNQLKQDKDKFFQEISRLIRGKSLLEKDKQNLVQEKKRLIQEKLWLNRENDEVIQEKDKLLQENNQLYMKNTVLETTNNNLNEKIRQLQSYQFIGLPCPPFMKCCF